MTVLFYSDVSITGRGFKAVYRGDQPASMSFLPLCLILWFGNLLPLQNVVAGSHSQVRSYQSIERVPDRHRPTFTVTGLSTVHTVREIRPSV